MPFAPGQSGNIAGKAPGTLNRTTSAARTAIAAFVDANVPLLQELLAEIRLTDGPLAAYKCIMDVVEYHIPKLARIETTGDKGVQIFIGCRDSDVAIISSSELAGELPDSAKSLTPQDIDVPLCLPKVSDETLEK